MVNRYRAMELVQEALEETQRLAQENGKADELSGLFGGLWEMADAKATWGGLAHCCDRASESGLAPLMALTAIVWECWDATTGLWDMGIPHGTPESLHREATSMVRSGRGYRSLQNSCLMIHLRLGGLGLDEVAPR